MRLRLWVGSILFFSSLTAALAQSLSSTLSEKDTEQFRALEERALKGRLNAPVFDLRFSDTQKAKLESFKKDAQTLNSRVQDHVAAKVAKMTGKAPQSMGTADMTTARYSTLVFASLSMPDNDIKELYRSLAGTKDTAIVIRGLPKGTTTINEAIRKIQQIAIDMKLKDAPSVVMNPVWFEQYHVSVVPTIVKLKSTTAMQSVDPNNLKPKEPPKVEARVEGVLSTLWLNDRIREGMKGDLGRMGPVYEIGETDIVAEMQSRAAKIDWDAKKKNAYARVWNNLPFEELPKATQDKKRLVDPTFILKQDIKGTDGTVIAARGTKVNPLDSRPFTRLMVVFNGDDEKEIEFVRSHLKQWQKRLGKKDEQTFLILTKLNRQKGWKAYEQITKTMDAKIYLLQNDIKTSFQLEASPCLVYQQGRYFAVEEYKVQ